MFGILGTLFSLRSSFPRKRIVVPIGIFPERRHNKKDWGSASKPDMNRCRKERLTGKQASQPLNPE